jgi:hypothetical protein
MSSCEPNKSGPDCDIPYEICPDNKRKCFNNSKCTLNKNQKNPLTNQYDTYSCDCTWASTQSTQFAGYECEHSDTAICPNVKDGYGSKFCTNGGNCMNFVYEARVHTGCACPTEFVGAHCQYLNIDVPAALKGEALFPDVHPNFWGFTTQQRVDSKATHVAIGISVCAILMVSFAFTIALMKRRKRGLFREDDKNRLAAIDPVVIEADGSGTMKDENEIL